MKTKVLITSFLCLVMNSASFAQDDYDYDYEEDEAVEDTTRFSFGINIGAYFANKNTATIYTGRPEVTAFGIPFILNQPLYQQTFRDYFRYDFYIAEYPVEPVYRTASEMGVHAEYDVNEKIDLYADFNIAQLRFEQFFTIGIREPNSGRVDGDRLEQFGIFGRENRFLLNLGAQFSLYNDEYANAYWAVFGQLNNIQMRRNFIVINEIEYDIYHRAFDRPDQRLGGIGYGGGTGLGFKYQLTETLKTDFYYNVSYAQTNMKESLQPYGFNHSIGIRIIWD